MKKGFLCVLLVCACVILSACGANVGALMKENMAELTKVYYYGEGEDVYATLSSGEREENYLLDGCCGNVVGFALLVVKFENNLQKNVLKAEVVIDGVGSQIELELNENNDSFMFDLEKILTGNESVEVVVEGKKILLDAVSRNFVVDCEDVIEIACNEFADVLQSLTKSQSLLCEGYLRVMDKKANNFSGVFWCFTLLDRNGNNLSAIISTEDGSVLAKSM